MTIRRAFYILAACLLAVTVAGCGKSSNSSGSAQIRFFNGLVDAGPINVAVGSKTPVSGLPFEGQTLYQGVDSGNQEFKVGITGGTSTIIDTTLSLSSSNYTYIVYGTSSAPTAQLLSDSITDPASGLFQIRVTNVAFGSSGVDVYITTPGASLDTASPNISNITYGASSAFTQLTPGSLQLRLTLHNSKQVIYDAGTVTFGDRVSYGLVVYTKGSSALVNATLFTMDSAGNGTLINSKIAQFKVVHAAPGTAAINAFVDGTVAFANIPYQNASSYETLPAGTHNVTIETVTAPGAVIASAQPPFPSSTDTSVVVTGSPGAQTAVVLADNNLPGTTGAARVRFVNVATNLGAVDVLVNFSKRVSNLGPNAASSYIELPEDTYAINFDLAGTTTVVLTIPAVSVTAARTYTLYLVGASGSLTYVLTRDD
ncbi:MAG TPA: DUF4397 domain-containing protein [Casimicrobiaceae bacterium]|jgi:hypothetical protein